MEKPQFETPPSLQSSPEDIATILDFISNLNTPKNEEFLSYFSEDDHIPTEITAAQVEEYLRAHPQSDSRLAGYAKYEQDNSNRLNYSGDEMYFCADIVKWIGSQQAS